MDFKGRGCIYGTGKIGNGKVFQIVGVSKFGRIAEKRSAWARW